MNPSAHIKVDGLSWVKGSGGYVPEGAVKGGYRSGEGLYVGLVEDPDAKFRPAKIARSAKRANYHYQSTEKTSNDYLVLVCSPDAAVDLKWIHATNGDIPQYAVQGYRSELYIGRHEASGELVVGEVDKAEQVCIVVTGLKAYSFPDYEVLCAIPKATDAAAATN